MLLPFLGFCLNVARNVPTSQANELAGQEAYSARVFRKMGAQVIRPGLPESVRSRFGVVAKSLLAFFQCCKSVFQPLPGRVLTR